MEVGMLWFDNDKKTTFEEKVNLAVLAYIEKYTVYPNTCVVNHSMFEEGTKVISGINMQKAKNIHPNYFWIGVEL